MGRYNTGEAGIESLESVGETFVIETELAHVHHSRRGTDGDLLLLFDTNGHRVAKLSDSLEDFDELCNAVVSRVTETRKSVETRVRLARDWRMSALMLIMGGCLGTGAIFFGWGTLDLVVTSWRLEAEGVLGEGEVTEHYQRDDGRELWLGYAVTGTSGIPVDRRTEVEESLWKSVAVGDSVAVRYVPDAPHVSELRTGELNPVGLFGAVAFLCLWIFGGVMAAVFVGAALLHLTCRDVKRSPSGFWFVLQHEPEY